VLLRKRARPAPGVRTTKRKIRENVKCELACRRPEGGVQNEGNSTAPPKRLFWVAVPGGRWRIDWPRTNRGK